MHYYKESTFVRKKKPASFISSSKECIYAHTWMVSSGRLFVKELCGKVFQSDLHSFTHFTVFKIGYICMPRQKISIAEAILDSVPAMWSLASDSFQPQQSTFIDI